MVLPMTDPIPWLLEPQDPGVRYLALRDLLKLSSDDPELQTAQRAAHTHGPIAAILDAMHPQGYWARAGAGYNPKYTSTDWSLITLAQLGASLTMDIRIATACEYLLTNALTKQGQFSMDGSPSRTIDCLQGNLCTALVGLGCVDPRLELAFEYMARSVTGEGIAPAEDREAPLRFYPAKCGPGFACGYNGQMPCAWGAAKVVLAFSHWPADRRTTLMERAIRQGLHFLLGRDLARADYPTRNAARPSPNWRKLGFPVFYITDILQVLEALTSLGYRDDPRLANALELVRRKQDDQGRWNLEYHYTGKTWVDFGALKQPNKWVTLRALKVLKELG
jgi:hypothetical protein